MKLSGLRLTQALVRDADAIAKMCAVISARSSESRKAYLVKVEQEISTLIGVTANTIETSTAWLPPPSKGKIVCPMHKTASHPETIADRGAPTEANDPLWSPLVNVSREVSVTGGVLPKQKWISRTSWILDPALIAKSKASKARYNRLYREKTKGRMQRLEAEHSRLLSWLPEGLEVRTGKNGEARVELRVACEKPRVVWAAEPLEEEISEATTASGMEEGEAEETLNLLDRLERSQNESKPDGDSSDEEEESRGDPPPRRRSPISENEKEAVAELTQIGSGSASSLRGVPQEEDRAVTNQDKGSGPREQNKRREAV
jgi:hypothetical protein